MLRKLFVIASLVWFSAAPFCADINDAVRSGTANDLPQSLRRLTVDHWTTIINYLPMPTASRDFANFRATCRRFRTLADLSDNPQNAFREQAKSEALILSYPKHLSYLFKGWSRLSAFQPSAQPFVRDVFFKDNFLDLMSAAVCFRDVSLTLYLMGRYNQLKDGLFRADGSHTIDYRKLTANLSDVEKQLLEQADATEDDIKFLEQPFLPLYNNAFYKIEGRLFCSCWYGQTFDQYSSRSYTDSYFNERIAGFLNYFLIQSNPLKRVIFLLENSANPSLMYRGNYLFGIINCLLTKFPSFLAPLLDDTDLYGDNVLLFHVLKAGENDSSEYYHPSFKTLVSTLVKLHPLKEYVVSQYLVSQKLREEGMAPNVPSLGTNALMVLSSLASSTIVTDLARYWDEHINRVILNQPSVKKKFALFRLGSRYGFALAPETSTQILQAIVTQQNYSYGVEDAHGPQISLSSVLAKYSYDMPFVGHKGIIGGGLPIDIFRQRGANLYLRMRAGDSSKQAPKTVYLDPHGPMTLMNVLCNGYVPLDRWHWEALISLARNEYKNNPAHWYNGGATPLRDFCRYGKFEDTNLPYMSVLSVLFPNWIFETDAEKGYFPLNYVIDRFYVQNTTWKTYEIKAMLPFVTLLTKPIYPSHSVLQSQSRLRRLMEAYRTVQKAEITSSGATLVEKVQQIKQLTLNQLCHQIELFKRSLEAMQSNLLIRNSIPTGGLGNKRPNADRNSSTDKPEPKRLKVEGESPSGNHSNGTPRVSVLQVAAIRSDETMSVPTTEADHDELLMFCREMDALTGIDLRSLGG